MQIVLLSGKQGSGKSTIQKALLETWGRLPAHKAVSLNFADPLYEMMYSVQDVSARYGISPTLPKDGKLLQVLGTEWGRATRGENVWIDCLRHRLEIEKVAKGLFAYDYPLTVVGDCRFKNEFEAFPEALKVRLVCPEPERQRRCEHWRDNSQHQSEIDLDDYARQGKFDIYIHTDSVVAQAGVNRIIDVLQEGVGKRGETGDLSLF